MRIAVATLCGLLAFAAPSAFAQSEECWNPRAHHFEGVRPGEYQDDLDYRYCRPTWRGRGQPDWFKRDRECWNPRARHFEKVRPGERQGDLDFSRCRPLDYRSGHGGRPHRRDDGPRECWNPRARHYEAVRPGERQDDLDFGRCRDRR